jgi:hypothetical protein
LSGLGGGLGEDYVVYDTSGNLVPANTAAAPAASSFNWDSWLANLIGGVAKTGETVITQQNLAKGVYTQTNKDGTITYVQPAGNTANIFGATSTGITGTGTASSGMGLVLIAGAGLLLVFMMAKGR